MKDERHHLEELSSRIKEEAPKFIEEQFGHIEQQRPHKPSFLLVVMLFAATIIIVFILAIVFLHLGGNKLGSHSVRKSPTSQLVRPKSTSPPMPSRKLT